MSNPVDPSDGNKVALSDVPLTTTKEDGPKEALAMNPAIGVDGNKKDTMVEENSDWKTPEASTTNAQASKSDGTQGTGPDPGTLASSSTGATAAPVPPDLQRQRNAPAPAPAHPGAFSVVPMNQMNGVAAGGGNNDAEDNSDSSVDAQEGAVQGDSNAGLAVATAVDDVPVQDLESAREVKPMEGRNSDKQQRWNELVMLGVCLCGLVVLVVVMVVLVAGDNSDSTIQAPRIEDNSTSTTEAPLPSPLEVLFPILPALTVAKLQEDAELGVSSPQTLALEFLLGDPLFYDYTETRLRQRFALATFYYSTDGPTWGPDWLNVSTHECEWQHYTPPYEKFYNKSQNYLHYYYQFIDGPCDLLNYTLVNITVPVNATAEDSNTTTVTVMTDKEYGEFRFLSMAYTQVNGALPEELKMLTSLNMLHFEGSTYDGTIPTFLAEMKSLEEISFPDSYVNGPIPSELGLLSNLNVINVEGVEITGTLPTELALLTNLSVMKFTFTSIEGTIPTEYGQLSHIKHFLLNDQLLTGTIATELGLMTEVQWWFVDSNNLTGTIPSEIGQLEKAWSIYFQENSLTGTIPTLFGAMPDLKQLHFGANHFTGTLPSEFGNNTEMWRLRWYDNLLTGTIPNEYTNLSQIQKFWGWNNMMTGTIPDFGQQTYLTDVKLANNQFSGTLFSGVDRFLRRMKDLDVSGNELTGTLPELWGTYTLMTSLQVQENYFSGTIPTTLGFIPDIPGTKNQLGTINLAHNFFEGTIPLLLQETVLTGLLRYFNISGNEGLSGIIPEGVCYLVNPESPDLVRVLSFDCSDHLCGCECFCHGALNGTMLNQTLSNQTLYADGLDEMDMMNTSDTLFLP